MKQRVAVILVVMAVGALFGLQRVTLAQNSAADTAAQAGGNLRILSPNNGQSIAQSFVDIRYELLNPAVAASPTPTFQLQLDAADPIRTASTDYTFTGLAPGDHAVMVELVDANNTPVAGSRRFVRFTVLPVANPGASTSSAEPQVQPAALVNPGESPQQSDNNPSPAVSQAQDQLPATGSALPLLSVIGFGVLLGGIASAMKTR